MIDVDEEKGEFWVPNPWHFSQTPHNLSAYERNGIHLNLHGGDFADISYLSGADNPGDSRTVVSGDVTGDGMPELFLRQAGGGALIVYENNFPKQSWIRISLLGTKSNSMGIGSKIELDTGDQIVRRELFPVVNFLSQAPAWVETGLGKVDKIKKLTVKWPSGKTQILEDVAPNRHIYIDEDLGIVEEPFKRK